LGKLF